MPADDISFELDRFEWAGPDRLEVEGTWHGVRRRLPRPTLVVEVGGKPRRLRALPEAGGSSERWIAAFRWEGEMPKLPGAELELGRGIVVDLPRPRRSSSSSSKARGAPAEPLPASSRDEREAAPGQEEADRLLAVLSAARTDADEAARRTTTAEAEAEGLRERAEAAEAEMAATDAAALRSRAEEAEAELETLRAEGAEAELAAADVSALRSRLEEAQAELKTLRTRTEAAELATADVSTLQLRLEDAENEVEELRARAEDAEGELAPLLARADDAEAELAALRAEEAPAAAPDLERLRAELETVERERMELRAQLDTTAERLEAAEQARSQRDQPATAAMPGPRTAAAGHIETAGSRFGRAEVDDPNRPPHHGARRPAQRTARHTDTTTAEPAESPPGGRISEWVSSLTGSRVGPQNGHAEAPRSGAARADRLRSAQGAGAASRTPRRSDPRAAAGRDGPSWILRVAAVGLLALLMIALLVIVFSLL